MGYKFGSRSLEKLRTCHPDLQKVLSVALSKSLVDFGVSEGHRTIETQQKYYAIGRTVDTHKKTITNVDGVTKKGKHNFKPSLAVDIYIWHDNANIRKRIAYDPVHLGYIAGLIESVAYDLKERGEISHTVRWGNNWDRDGIIAYDQNLDDAPHFELI